MITEHLKDDCETFGGKIKIHQNLIIRINDCNLALKVYLSKFKGKYDQMYQNISNKVWQANTKLASALM